MKSTTIKDLAKIVNMSTSTVSRALSGHSDVNSKTKEKVLHAAKLHNYQPNLIAKSLQNKRSNTIGVIVPEIRNPFFATLISGIEEVGYEAGYSIMVCQSAESYERELVNLRALVANNVAGILMSPSLETKTAKHINDIKNDGTPIVVFDRTMEGLEASSVVVDDFNGAFQAVTHLVNKGYSKIAHLTGNETMYVSKKRREGYIAALKKNNIRVNPQHIITCGIYEEDGAKGAELLFESNETPDAIFAFNDPVALGAMNYLRERGCKIPEDVGVIGFANNPEAAMISPGLTSVDQPAEKIGETAIKMLLHNLQGNLGDQEIKEVVLKTQLVIRESC